MNTAPAKFITVSAKSAATGRPHYFGRLYEDLAACMWCGNGRDHEWHLDRQMAVGERVQARRLTGWSEYNGRVGTVREARPDVDEFGATTRAMLLVHWDGDDANAVTACDQRAVDRVAA